jgi:hypothetical protein
LEVVKAGEAALSLLADELSSADPELKRSAEAAIVAAGVDCISFAFSGTENLLWYCKGVRFLFQQYESIVCKYYMYGASGPKYCL